MHEAIEGPAVVTISRDDEKPRGKLVISSVEITPAKNGGFTVKCYKRPEHPRDGFGYIEPESYAFSDWDATVKWLGNTFGNPAGMNED